MNRSKLQIAHQPINNVDPEEKTVADAKQTLQAFAALYNHYVSQI